MSTPTASELIAEGQKFPVTVVQIVSNLLEREIFRRLETSMSLQGALLDLVRKGEL